MYEFPVQCRFVQRTSVPILEISISSEERGTENYLMKISLKLIEKAEKYEGIPFQTESREIIMGNVLVQFAILFPDQNKLKEFVTEEGDISSN